jgi:hypothetical protein
VVPGKAPLFFPDPYDGDKLKPVTTPLPSTVAEQTPDSGTQKSAVTPSKAPDPNREPEGKPKPVKSDPQTYGDREDARSATRENESAKILAQNGYRVFQTPPPKPNDKEPDYQIEGEYADCYSPITDKVDNVRGSIEKKVNDDQADIIVVNLQDAPNITSSDLESSLRANPISGLRQVFILRDGQIVKNITF